MGVHRSIRVLLQLVAGFNLLSACAGMVLLVFVGGDSVGMPPEWLARTPFSTWAWPGLILGLVVGGAQVLALIAQHRRLKLTWGLHAASGLVMMIWIFIELAMLLVWSPLHAIYFAAGLIQTVLAVLALGAWPRPLFACAPWRSGTVGRAQQSGHAPVAD
ncbi:hypothetical protein ITJ43_01980 [Microbacterium sp. VKM Ac-2870]|uniref:hypothetical protein n=1 Tax=Microbacterium sp. VKM Ac-2870 TaxID=2783825 RepID=UPI00188C63FD|nr:hypothetical protein [Microbacterium sp. VKM Ac-2870]MBF4560900.1 hypothetical protein [Microbacterium sp. VKM Ac-2870]